MSWRKAFFSHPVVFIDLFIRTFRHPKVLKTKQRDELNNRILELSDRIELRTKVSDRINLNTISLEKVPSVCGVYRIYEKDLLQYIGKSSNLRRRLASHISSSHNEDLNALISSSNASFEWYEVVFEGWVECYEHVRFLEQNGHLPPLNKKLCGDSWE